MNIFTRKSSWWKDELKSNENLFQHETRAIRNYSRGIILVNKKNNDPKFSKKMYWNIFKTPLSLCEIFNTVGAFMRILNRAQRKRKFGICNKIRLIHICCVVVHVILPVIRLSLHDDDDDVEVKMYKVVSWKLSLLCNTNYKVYVYPWIERFFPKCMGIYLQRIDPGINVKSKKWNMLSEKSTRPGNGMHWKFAL